MVSIFFSDSFSDSDLSLLYDVPRWNSQIQVTFKPKRQT